jgi:hypothetical protein
MQAMNDPIVDEVRRVRETYAAKFNYDLDAIFLDLKEQERRSGLTFVSYGKEAIASEVKPDAVVDLTASSSSSTAGDENRKS